MMVSHVFVYNILTQDFILTNKNGELYFTASPIQGVTNVVTVNVMLLTAEELSVK